MNENTYGMVVYYDLIFLLNLIYQFGILCFANKLLRSDRPVVKIVCAAMVQSFLFVVITFSPISERQVIGRIVNQAVSFGVSMVLFRAYSMKKILRLLLTELVLCVLLGGILTMLFSYTGNGYLLLTAAGSIVFLGLFAGSLKELFAYAVGKRNCFYTVRLIHKGKKAETRGLLDSGNSLTDPFSGKPVCIISRDLCGKFLDGEDIGSQNGYRLIPYHTIGKKSGLMEAFLVDGMEIIQDSEAGQSFFYHEVLCAVSPEALSNRRTYEMIFHPDLFS